MEMLKDPPAGFGKNMNPCMDCHSLMFAHAGRIMLEEGFDFLFSGEVAGQRPFSQNKRSMRYVEKHSGFDGHIVRPLSAKLLPETLVEKEGLVDRERLCSISGRSRKVQIAMAKKFGVTDYPAPAGGCLLTDKNFSRRLKDLLDTQKNYKKRDLHLLKFGRHFRLDTGTRIVVGRSQGDNNSIVKLFNPDTDILVKHAFLPGPVLLIPSGVSLGMQTQEIVTRSASICAGYTKTPAGDPAQVRIQYPGEEVIITVETVKPNSIQGLVI